MVGCRSYFLTELVSGKREGKKIPLSLPVSVASAQPEASVTVRGWKYGPGDSLFFGAVLAEG